MADEPIPAETYDTIEDVVCGFAGVQRSIVRLLVDSDLTTREIATSVNMPVPYVAMVTQKAKRLLRERLEHHEVTEDLADRLNLH